MDGRFCRSLAAQRSCASWCFLLVAFRPSGAATHDACVAMQEARESSSMQYNLQGDMEMHTLQNLRMRISFRSKPRIMQVLGVWWETAQRSAFNLASLPDTLDQEGHAKCLRPVYRALVDDYDPEEMEEVVADDWRSDSRGEPELSRDMFCDAIFELADVWTEGLSQDEYVDFLWSLFEYVSCTLEHGSLVWKSVDDVKFMGHGSLRLGGGGQVVSSSDDWASTDAANFQDSDQQGGVLTGVAGMLRGVGYLGRALARLGGHTREEEQQEDGHAFSTKDSGALRRREVGKRQRKRGKGAAKIQAFARGKRDRRVTVARRRAVSIIHAGARGMRGRRTARTRRDAIVTIQKSARRQWGGYSPARALRASILAVQAVARGALIRKQLAKIKSLREKKAWRMV